LPCRTPESNRGAAPNFDSNSGYNLCEPQTSTTDASGISQLSFWTLCPTFALCSMHCIQCIVFNALHSMLCSGCIVLYELHAMHCMLCIVFYALYSMHCILCIVLYALYSMHCMYSMHCTLILK
jgi:hypothetical protein